MQQRFNIFNQIHKALRALLYDTALTLQQTYFGNPDEVETALEKLRLILDIFDKHADHEDQFVLPAIQAYEPSLVDAFEKEHVEDHESFLREASLGGWALRNDSQYQQTADFFLLCLNPEADSGGSRPALLARLRRPQTNVA